MSNPHGRPPSQPPALAWDYRRVILVTQVAALGDIEALLSLAKAWRLSEEGDFETLAVRLARAAIAQRRKEQR